MIASVVLPAVVAAATQRTDVSEVHVADAHATATISTVMALVDDPKLVPFTVIVPPATGMLVGVNADTVGIFVDSVVPLNVPV